MVAYSLGIPKRAQDFLFFTIQDAAAFKKDLKQLIPAITTTAQLQQVRNQINQHKSSGATDLVKVCGLSISFTFTGLTKVSFALSSHNVCGMSNTIDLSS